MPEPANGTTVVTRETVVTETSVTTEEYVRRRRRPRRNPPVLLIVFFALVLAYFAIFTLMFNAPAYTAIGIMLLFMSFALLSGAYLALD